MISVMMPQSLIDELRENAKRDHFMDLSEELRYIIKENYQKSKDPYEHELIQFREEIKRELKSQGQDNRIRLLNELKGILEEMKDE